MKTQTFKATIDNLDDVLAFIDEELENAECSIKTLMQINIAVEELFVNIAHYAYKSGVGEVDISIRITDDPAMAEITLNDLGIPYDPLAKEDPDVNLSAEERQIGGLGIYMVKKTMDLMTYSYENGHNIVTICKYL